MPFDCQHGGPRGQFGGFQRVVKMRVLGASTGGIEASRRGDETRVLGGSTGGIEASMGIVDQKTPTSILLGLLISKSMHGAALYLA